jgi:glutamine cyclotransferase
MTTDGESLVMSDGTARLRFLDPKTFAVRRTVDVHDGASPVSQLNELEWVKGEILANVWQSTQIVRIDPKTGAVTAWIDAGALPAAADRTGREDVLNGHRVRRRGRQAVPDRQVLQPAVRGAAGPAVTARRAR